MYQNIQCRGVIRPSFSAVGATAPLLDDSSDRRNIGESAPHIFICSIFRYLRLNSKPLFIGIYIIENKFNNFSAGST